MPDPTLDQLSMLQQHWGTPPLPGDVHTTPQTGKPGTLQGSIEESGQTPPQWLVGANDWLSQHRGLTEAIKNLSEGLPGPTELGMFKFIPSGGRFESVLNPHGLPNPNETVPGSFRVLGHNDEYVADIENAFIDHKGDLHVDIYGAHHRKPKAGISPEAEYANRLSHTFPPEELAEMARAGLKEFPGLKPEAKAYGNRISGSRSKRGPASSGKTPLQSIPIQRFLQRFPEQFPPAPEDPQLSKELLDLALESIKKPPVPKPPTPTHPPRPLPPNWLEVLRRRMEEE